jgi:hypothetical protein
MNRFFTFQQKAEKILLKVYFGLNAGDIRIITENRKLIFRLLGTGSAEIRSQCFFEHKLSN